MLEAERPLEGEDFFWPTSADEREVPVVLFVEANNRAELDEILRRYSPTRSVKIPLYFTTISHAVVKVVDGVSVAIYEKVLGTQGPCLC